VPCACVQVIKGWEEAAQTMKKGELAEFTLKPEYAYGAAGSPPKIPANATLVFEIEMLSWTSEKDVSKAKDGSVLKKTIKEVRRRRQRRQLCGI
jgi:FK506-binding protein 4/5